MNEQVVYTTEQEMLPDVEKDCRYCAGQGCVACLRQGTECARLNNMRMDESYLCTLFNDALPKLEAPYGSSVEDRERYEKEQAQLPLEEQNCRWCKGTIMVYDEVCFARIRARCPRCEGTGKMAIPIKRQRAIQEFHERGA